MKKEDELMKEFLQEELEKESARIKEEVEQDPPLTESGPDPELKNKIWKQAEEIRRQREAYDRREEKAREEFSEELAPESLELAAGAEERQPESHSEIQTAQGSQTPKVRMRKRRKKTIVALAVALVAVLGVGMTSFGDGGFVAETVDRILGGRKTTNINSESENTDVTQQEEIAEEKVFQQIKNEFGFDAVRLDYKPKKMKMVDSMVDQTLLIANIYYELNDQQITYTIIPVYRDSSSGYDVEDEIVSEYIKEVKGTQIEVTEYKIKDLEQLEFSAHFRHEDAEYILTGIIEKEEFEKILENLHFF